MARNGTAASSPHEERWDFLKGAGPSSQEYYYAEERKSFKPGWKSLRPYQNIHPDTERKAQEEQKAVRQAACGQLKAERLHAMLNKSNINPITGQERKADGFWAPASDPWQHQRLGLKPVHSSCSSSSVRLANQEPQLQRSAAVSELRRERMQTEGLTQTKRTGGTVKELMVWQT